MTDKRHYRIDYVTFCQILGFGRTHRSYTNIHECDPFEIRDISDCWVDPDSADGKRRGLKGFFYVMNNLCRSTIDPKDGAASDVNSYARNLLAYFRDGKTFNVGRFIWVQLAVAMDDGRRNLPYAPYLMFMIERVTGRIFPKDGFHTVYKIEKTKSYAAGRMSAGGTSAGREDIPESSRPSSRRRKGLKTKVKAWMRAIFGHCTYTSQQTYETRREIRQAFKSVRERQGLAPLPPFPRPPQYDLPDLSGTSSSSEQLSHGWSETLGGFQQQYREAQQAPPRRSSRRAPHPEDDEATSGGRADSDED